MRPLGLPRWALNSMTGVLIRERKEKIQTQALSG